MTQPINEAATFLTFCASYYTKLSKVSLTIKGKTNNIPKREKNNSHQP